MKGENMSDKLQRSWLIVAVGGTALWRLVRTLERVLPQRQVVIIGVRPYRNGSMKVILKKFGKAEWRVTVNGELNEELLERVTETALSSRDQNLLKNEFGDCFGSVQFDFLTLIDSNDKRCGSPYGILIQRLAEQTVLYSQSGVSLRILFPGKPDGMEPEIAKALKFCQQKTQSLFKHTITLGYSSIDKGTIQRNDLAELAGKWLGALLTLESENIVRSMFGRVPTGLPRSMRYWSFGYSTVSSQIDGFIKYIHQCYVKFLSKIWLQKKFSTERIHKLAKNILKRLINSKIPNNLLGDVLNKKIVPFFLGLPEKDGKKGPALLDLQTFLIELVKELAVYSRDISVNQPCRPVRVTRTQDTRSWIRKFINRISYNRFFKWEEQWQSTQDIAAQKIIRKQRIAALNVPIMKLQLAVRETIDILQKTRQSSNSHLSCYEVLAKTQVNQIINKEHTNILAELKENIIKKSLLSGVSPLSKFKECLLKNLKISENRKLELDDAMALIGQSEINQMIRSLVEQAAPWWNESYDVNFKEHKFAFLPRSKFSKLNEDIEIGVKTIFWNQDAYGAMCLLQGCVPEMLKAELIIEGIDLPKPSREWVSMVKVG